MKNRKEKEGHTDNAFPLVYSLRSTNSNADLDRKINKKVFLYIIHPKHSWPLL